MDAVATLRRGGASVKAAAVRMLGEAHRDRIRSGSPALLPSAPTARRTAESKRSSSTDYGSTAARARAAAMTARLVSWLPFFAWRMPSRIPLHSAPAMLLIAMLHLRRTVFARRNRWSRNSDPSGSRAGAELLHELLLAVPGKPDDFGHQPRRSGRVLR